MMRWLLAFVLVAISAVVPQFAHASSQGDAEAACEAHAATFTGGFCTLAYNSPSQGGGAYSCKRAGGSANCGGQFFFPFSGNDCAVDPNGLGCEAPTCSSGNAPSTCDPCASGYGGTAICVNPTPGDCSVATAPGACDPCAVGYGGTALCVNPTPAQCALPTAPGSCDPCASGYGGTAACSNPTPAQCAANPTLPACAHAPPDCTANPTAAGCQDICTAHPETNGCPSAPGYCNANPSVAGCPGAPQYCNTHPTAAGCQSAPDYCNVNPTASGCASAPDYCNVNPNAAGCSSAPGYCNNNPSAPGCPSAPGFCSLNPSAPGCPGSAPYCVDHPDDAACKNEANSPPFCSTHPDDAACKNDSNTPPFCGQPEHASDPSCPANKPGTLEFCAAHPGDLSCNPSANFCHTNPTDPSCVTLTCAANPNDPACHQQCDPSTDPNCSSDSSGISKYCQDNPTAELCLKPQAGGGGDCSTAPSCDDDPVGCVQVTLAWQTKCQAQQRFDARQSTPSGDCNTAPPCQGDPIECTGVYESWKASCANHADVSGPNDCTTEPTCVGDSLMCRIDSQLWHARCDGQQGFDPGAPENQAPDISGLTPAAVEVDDGDLSTKLDASGFLGAGTCPQFGSIQAIGATIDLDLGSGSFCTVMNLIGALVLATAYFKGARIILGG